MSHAPLEIHSVLCSCILCVYVYGWLLLIQHTVFTAGTVP